MRMNVDKVLERDSKLSQLDDRAGNSCFKWQCIYFVPTKILIFLFKTKQKKDALQMGASQFEQSAGALKRKFWWKNLKVALLFCCCYYFMVF